MPFPEAPADPYDYPVYLFIENGDCSEGNASENDLPDSFDCEGDWKYSDHRTAIRHHTGGWGVTAAALGDPPLGAADDGHLYLAAVTREGWLRLWRTDIVADSAAGRTALDEWPEYGHDGFNSGNYEIGETPPGREG